MSIPFIGFSEVDDRLNWIALSDAIAAGHRLPRAEISDSFLYRDKDTMLSRAAWIDGLGVAVKSATIFPDNEEPFSKINGAVSLFSDQNGQPEAFLDFHLVTKWKTAADSLLAARRLARPDSRDVLIVGSGSVASSMIDAYRSVFPEALFQIWSRTEENAEALAKKKGVDAVGDLQTAVEKADIICSATMSTVPVILGDWLQPGQHLDLIGAYRPDMREVDDVALLRSSVFVDSLSTTVDHIGELKIPISEGVITKEDITADYYDLLAFQRESDCQITLCKNGGGAHLDLMTCRHILNVWSS